MRLLCLLLAFSTVLCAADRWEMQFFHDEDKSNIVFTGLAFSSPERGIAVGIYDKKGERDGIVLVTVDGGVKWNPVEIKDSPRALHVLDDAHAWIVGESGVWFSDEGGRTWRRIRREKDLVDVFFTSPERGWVVGGRKKVLQTNDGGKKWSKIPEVEALDTSQDFTTFSTIDFNGKSGIIAGRSQRPRDGQEFPIWMDPEPEKRKEFPTLGILLETRDGGEKWTPSKMSLFGTITRVRLGEAGRSLALVEFENFFNYPSEVYRLDTRSGKSERALRSANLAVTDVISVGERGAFAAGFQPLGKLARTPVPGRLRILRTADLGEWVDMEVDYRAVATRAHLSAIDEKHAWVATDTGMILRLRVE
jgi:photosystem II stability/assembly factor-like uncharacterized protein